MDIISRSEAIKLGLKRYFTNKECARGHIAERRVSTFVCIECSKLSSKDYDTKRYSDNPEYFSEKNKRWLRNNRDKRKEYIDKQREFHHKMINSHQQNKLNEGELISRTDARSLGLIHYYTGTTCKNGHVAKRVVSNGDCSICKFNKLKKDRQINNKKHLAYKSKRRAAEAMPSWITNEQQEEIIEIYNRAIQLSRETNIQYDVDHRIPLQGKNICGLHVPCNLQIIPHHINVVKANRLLLEEEVAYFTWLKEQGL